jgi:predicted ATPase
MISSFGIQGFKCFIDLTVELSEVTVLSGINGAGKSSFIQALLLTKLAQPPSAHVALNGPFELCLGQALDVARGQLVQLTVTNSAGAKGTWVLEAESDTDLTLRVAEASEPLPELLHLTYLQAERLGPRDFLRLDSKPDDELNVGARGEFVAQVLSQKDRRFNVEHARCRRREEVGTTLSKQVEAWLQDLVPGIELRVEAFPDLSAATVRLRQSGLATEWLRAQNLGFGVSYVLPIVVAGLVAPAGSLLIVENPEAHLHPQGQSYIARFLARVAAAGVQVVLETHSDHVINGLRLAAISDHPLRREQVTILHFCHDEEQPRVQRLRLTDRGGLTAIPEGFFDQSEKDLAAILEARRGGGGR